MSADYRTPAGSLAIATVLILATAVGLFAIGNLQSNELYRWYILGASASALGCSMLLFGASKAYRACAATGS